MSTRLTFMVVLFASGAYGDIFRYECDTFPEEAGFTREGTGDAVRRIEDGWLVQEIRGYGPGPNNGQFDGYRHPLAEFSGTDRFFSEWNLMSTGERSQIPGTAPAGLSFWGDIGINYHFTIADDQVKLRRDPRLPIHYIDIESGVPHAHRLELYGPYWFEYLIDGELVVAGVPEGQYPTADSQMIWWGSYYLTEHTTRWDYLRWGQLAGPEFDCDGIKRLRAKCQNGKVKGKIRTELVPGTALRVTNSGDRRTVQVGDNGKAKFRYRRQSGDRTILLLDCPAISQDVSCDP